MASKPISQRKRFDSAIVLRSFYMANPFSNGFTELAIRSTSETSKSGPALMSIRRSA